MKETERIAELFEDMYEGEPWIDVTLLGTLQQVKAEVAAKKIDPRWNSVWEIVNHIIRWRENVLLRVQGSTIQSPADNYFSTIEDVSAEAWKSTLEDLKISQQKWIAFLQKMNEEDLLKVYAKNNATYYKNIQGIIQHDAYHLGQIVLLLKQ